MLDLPVPTALSLPKEYHSHAQKHFLCSFSDGMSPMVTQACPICLGCRENVPHDITRPQEGPTAGRLRLTQHTDKGIGQQVAMFVGCVTLVHCSAADLSVPEDDSVSGHLTVGIGWCRYR